MSFAKVLSAQVSMLAGQIITVEVDITRGLNNFSLVGLPDKAVDEARDRVGSALKNSGFSSPKHQNQKTIVSLAPANIKKEGPYFDTAIALAYLICANELKVNNTSRVYVGELALDGSSKPVSGILPIVECAVKNKIEEIYVPYENTKEAGLINGIKIFGYKNLKELFLHLDETNTKENGGEKLNPVEETKIEIPEQIEEVDFCIIRGQESAKRGLLIAACGGHNIAMYGPPGTGKTMLARAFTNLLPHLDKQNILEVTGIHSTVKNMSSELVVRPPFRSPHHTASYVSIIGGGSNVKPGEVTLAHRGVLFLDEFPEFDKKVIESLRQPLEDKIVTISRAKGTSVFPSDFILIAAMNPCPCGYKDTKTKECICTSQDLTRYKRKISGPIVDRIDLWVAVEAVDYEKLSAPNSTELENEKLKKKIKATREFSKSRFSKHNLKYNLNSELKIQDLEKVAHLTESVKNLLNKSAEKLELSPRAYHKVIRLARTIADIEGEENIKEDHILEALQYRAKISK